MGGRYGGSDDGSNDYQDRRPADDDRSDEQQTIADAIQAVADHHADDGGSASGRTNTDGSSDGSSSQHPFTTLRSGAGKSGSPTLQEIDQQIAEYVADQLTGTVEDAAEETDPSPDED